MNAKFKVTDMGKLKAIMVSVPAAWMVAAQPLGPQTLTLVCNGVEQPRGSFYNKSLNDLGIIVDYTRNTVSFQNNTFPILSIDTTSITFKKIPAIRGQERVTGTIDRVTGAVAVTFDSEYYDKDANRWFDGLATHWRLHCRPTTRLF